MFYGQFKTDKYIAEFFPADFVGTCIDIGAARPKRNNNTYYFEERGWTAYCIEPNPNYIPNLKSSRKNVYNIALGDKDADNVEFTVCTLENGNEEPVSSLTIDNDLLLKHQIYNPRLSKILVSVRTLNTFITDVGIKNIDFLSIDTEGTELDILRGFALEKYKPKLLVIENNFSDTKIENYLLAFGYQKKKRVAINDFFVLNQ